MKMYIPKMISVPFYHSFNIFLTPFVPKREKMNGNDGSGEPKKKKSNNIINVIYSGVPHFFGV